MTLSQLIVHLQELQQHFGDLPVHDHAHFLVERVRIVTAEADQFPEDWDMPEGYQFVQIGLDP
jgi:hypothetical protein